MKTLENKIGYVNGSLGMTYQPWLRTWNEFMISGAWGSEEYFSDIFYLIYVGAKLNFRQSVIDAFCREEEDWIDVWNAN